MIRFLTIMLGFSLTACTAQLKTKDDTSPAPSPITWTECSQNIGDHPCEMILSDQHAKPWSLYEGWGDIQVLDFFKRS